MAPSPKNSETRARVIRELAGTFPRSSPPRSLPSPTPPERDIDDSSLHLPTASSFNPEQEALNSTQQMDTQTANNLRSTARQYRYGNYGPPQTQQPVPTSVVRKEFGDFDFYDNEESEEEDSVELGRGGRRSLRGTPNKSGDLFMSSMHFNSLYDVTPPTQSRAPTRRGNLPESGNLRRDAQIRHASAKPQADIEPHDQNTSSRKKSTYADLHAKVMDEDSFQDERPRFVTSTFRGTRFGTSRSRDASLNFEKPTTQEYGRSTPQRQSQGTPRSSLPLNKDTQQSFMLPDLPNLTELVSGVFKDGTPVFSKSSRGRSRFSSAPDPNRLTKGQPNYIPVKNVPVPEDEKALFAALQLLKEKVAQLEKENAESQRTIEDQESEITNLRAEKKARDAMRSSDSALGSTDEEEGGRNSWKTQKSRLEASVETLRTRLDRTDRKLSVAETHNKRISAERDQLQEQLTKAFVTSEELKQESDALQNENQDLRTEIDALRSENGELRAENEDLRANRASDQARHEEETVQLRNNLGRQDSAVQKENDTLHAELRRVRTHHDEEAQRWARKEADLRAKKSQQEQAELNKLKSNNDALRKQLKNAKLQREEEERRWNDEEAGLRQRLGQRDETIRRFQELSPDEANETLRFDNDNLRIELEKLATAREEEQDQWQRKEDRLRRRIEKREEALRDLQDATGEIVTDRQATAATRKSSAAPLRPATTGLKRNASNRKEKDTQMRLSEAVEQEVRNSRNAASSYINSRDAARRPGNATTSRFLRSASVPVDQALDRESDAESTTDLSIGRTERQANAFMTGAKPKPKTFAVGQSGDGDYTNLSFMDGNEIARLRKTLEEERAALRRNEVLESVQQDKNETLQSMRSANNTGRSLPRKSSMKDVSGRNAMPKADETANTKATEVSVISNSSRRRRSAPLEMTSAFILPDITVRMPQPTHNAKTVHEAKDCTVCQRSASDSNVPRLNNNQTTVDIPRPVPVSSRSLDDSNATIRPAQSPQDALALVLKELQDELTHLKLELAAQEALLQSHDPALGKRRRKAVQAKVLQLLKVIDVKADQIYALHDVLEGQKVDGLLDKNHAPQVTTGRRMTEEEVDNTLRSVGLDPREARKGKKVIIEEAERSELEGSDLGGLDDDDDLPWSGISDTESLAGPSRLQGRRPSVY